MLPVQIKRVDFSKFRAIFKISSYPFKKFNWKFRINVREMTTKNICKFLKLANE